MWNPYLVKPPPSNTRVLVATRGSPWFGVKKQGYEKHAIVFGSPPQV